MIPWVLLGCLAAAARPAWAQESVFVAAVQELAANSGRPAVRDRMRVALAGWDRDLDDLEIRASQASGAEAFERHVALGLAYRRRGRLDDARRHFDKAAALEAGASDVHLLRALTLEAAGKTDEARRAFREAWTRDAESPVKAYLALTRDVELEAAGRDRAMDVVRKAFDRVVSGSYRPEGSPFLTLDLVPDTASGPPVVGDGARAGVFARLAAGRLDEAIDAFTDPAPQGTAPASALARGRAAEVDGRFADARRDYAIALTGTLAGRHALHVGVARLAQVQGESDAAIEAFGQAVRLSPNDPAIHRELAAAHAAAGRAGDAFAELVAALLIAPGDAAALAAAGQLYIDTDRAAEAIPVLRRALVVRPDRYETHYALAVALSRAGHAADAAREFERFEGLSRAALEARRLQVAGEPGPREVAR